MTAVYIILGFLLFLFLILVIPVKVLFEAADGDFAFVLYFGFIKLFDSRKLTKEKSAKKHKKKTDTGNNKEDDEKPDEKKPSAVSKLFNHKKQELGLIEAVKFFLDILKDFLVKLVWLIRKIKIDRFRLNLVVCSDDAATTAINYGYFCTAVYPVLSFLSINTGLKLDKVNISADFNKTAILYDLFFRLRTRLIYFLILAIKLLLKYKNLIKEVKDYE